MQAPGVTRSIAIGVLVKSQKKKSPKVLVISENPSAPRKTSGKTKTLEMSKKRKLTSGNLSLPPRSSEAEKTVAATLVDLKKKKGSKKVISSKPRAHVVSALSDDGDNDNQKSSDSLFCCEVVPGRVVCSPSSESTFVDIESLSDKELAVAEKLEAFKISEASSSLEKEIVLLEDQTNDDDASLKFMADLDKTVRQGPPSHFPLLIQGWQDVPESGAVSAETYGYNQTFGTNLKGKLMFVGGDGIGRDDDPCSFEMVQDHLPPSRVHSEARL
jgi:hypothetical protein